MPKKVMIVEDNELNLKLFTDLLRAHQFTVEGVRDGRLALEQARMFAPDLVIMDIQLPHVSGIDLIEAMQKDAASGRDPRAGRDRLCRQRRRGADQGSRRARISIEAGVSDEVSGGGAGDCWVTISRA